MKLTEEQIEATAHLPSREAAQLLGVGKTTVNKYRKKYGFTADGRLSGSERAIINPVAWTPLEMSETLEAPGMRDDMQIAVSEATESPQTSVSLDDDLEADGVSNETHRLSYSYSEWDMADGTKGRSRRVTAVPVEPNAPVEEIDPHELLRQVREQTTPVEIAAGEEGSTFVLSFNDWQFGKKTLQGSSADTIRIVTEAVAKAKAKIAQLERAGYTFSELIIIFGGDLVEGCANTPQGAWGLEFGQRQQIEGAVALGLSVLDELAPNFGFVQVLAVRGNHGENRINGGRATTPEDNMDTLVPSLIRTAAERDPRLNHIEWTIADDHAGVYTATFDDWLLGTTHGDVYGKGVSGATTERKVNAWYKNMAAGRDPLGSVDVLITHHYHHSQSVDYGAWEWHQTPAQDGAMSEYFRQASGNYSEPGVLSFVMGEQRYMEEMVL